MLTFWFVLSPSQVDAILEFSSAEISLFHRPHLVVSGSQHHTPAHRQVSGDVFLTHSFKTFPRLLLLL